MSAYRRALRRGHYAHAAELYPRHAAQVHLSRTALMWGLWSACVLLWTYLLAGVL